MYNPEQSEKAVIEKLNAEINKIPKDPAVHSRLSDYELPGTTPRELTVFLDAEIDKHARQITASFAKID